MDGRADELLDGRYRLVEQLGVGGMSVVLRGYDEVLGRQVAVKALAPSLAADATFRRRIRVEAQAAARLSHPHITNVYDYGEAEAPDGSTVPYVVMELIDGPSLQSRLAGGAALPWREAVSTCTEVASALAAAHARGVVHRDITPSNVMLTPAGAKVVDFGISAVVGESDVDPDGKLFGTPAYLAPERLDVGAVSPATDVYALGVLLYRTLTGRLPLDASTTTQLLIAHKYTEPEPMPAVDGLPDGVAEVCRQCLAKRPEDRPASAEVARSLAGAIGLMASVPVSPAVPTSPATGPAGAAADDIAADLAAAGTTILPWASAVDALPGGRAGRSGGVARAGKVAGAGSPPRPAVTRRRAKVLLVGAGALAVGGVLWVGANRSSDDLAGASGGPPAGAGARPTDCRVDYQLRRDTGSRFAATLIVTNTGPETLKSWQVRFAFPGQQQLGRGNDGDWSQSGGSVEVRPDPGAAPLRPGQSVTLNFAGTHPGANPLPLTFDLDGKPCQALVWGADGRQVGGGTSGGQVVSQPGGGTLAGGPGTAGGPGSGGPGGPGPGGPGPGGPGTPGAPGGTPDESEPKPKTSKKSKKSKKSPGDDDEGGDGDHDGGDHDGDRDGLLPRLPHGLLRHVFG